MGEAAGPAAGTSRLPQPDTQEGGPSGPVLVSACLIGAACRYDGRDALAPQVRELLERGEAVACCPEELGGLGTPRPPAELVGGTGEDVLAGRARVVTAGGRDVTAAYLRGAHQALTIALELGARGAILKARSPSCGVYQVYDGSFSGQETAGDGVTAALLRRHGLRVCTEDDVAEQGVERVLAQLRGDGHGEGAEPPVLEIRLFAAAREAAGRERLELAWAGGSVADLRTALRRAEPALETLMPHLLVAVNGRYARADEPVAAGDEVALLPPVSGGEEALAWHRSPAGDRFALTPDQLAVDPLLRAADDDQAGALLAFVGSVRASTGTRETVRLEYEAYEEMALRCMVGLADRARRRWPVRRIAMVHRVGALSPNEWAVAVVVATPHRGEAFAAGRFLIDRLKVELPIWKKEIGPDGEAWVGLGG